MILMGEKPVNRVCTPGLNCCQGVLGPLAKDQDFGWRLARV
jgi:hypothetical protein